MSTTGHTATAGQRATGAVAPRTGSPDQPVLRVDWPDCRARGLCAELVPENIVLDEWGYPLVTGPVTRRALRHAREAVTSCPHQALRLIEPVRR